MRRFSARRPSRGPSNRPTRVWVNGTTGFAHSGVTVTTASIVMQLQAPADVTNLTADPPEDLTILRVRGSFQVSIAGSAAARWTLALTVQDVTWTPGATFTVDADKRILWSMAYFSTNATLTAWIPPNQWQSDTTVFPFSDPRCTFLDIAPKVKMEAGKALYLVAYEDVSGGSMTVVSTEMRLLFQRSRRR